VRATRGQPALRGNGVRSNVASLAACFALILAGCDRESPTSPPREAASATAHDVLPTRSEVVAHADALALDGTRKGGAAGAKLVFRAAELRERLYRLERREVDALESVELFGSVARGGGELACRASLRRTLVEAELRGDVNAAYRGIYGERARSADAACRAASDRALLGLAGYEPSREAPAELDARARGVASAAPQTSAAKAAQALVVVPNVTAVPSAPPEITSIERYGAEDAARVVVHITHPARFDMSFVEPSGDQPPRVVLDLPKVVHRGKKKFPVGGLVSAVRVGEQRDGTRLVLDLRGPAYRRAFYLPEPFRLVVDVSKDPPPSLSPGSRGPRSVRRVVLDPGHGGHDPGATGPSGLREKDVTLDVAHRAAPLIARELGIATLLTRDTDVFVPLDERTARANAFGADLLISIHCNANEDGSGRGIATFVLDDSTDATASRIAARENAASVEAAVELANALSRVIDQGTAERSAQFAALLQRATMASLAPRYEGAHDLGVRRAGFYVLAGARMPAVLYETSFISSPFEETRLNTPDYRQKLADAVVNAVRAYREGK
jgi:N-acetylmuramoyl-L-alanine amidase